MYPNKGIRFQVGDKDAGGGGRTLIGDRLFETTRGLATNTLSLNVANSLLQKITGMLGDVEKLQQSALSIGTTANELRKNLTGKIKDLPGGMFAATQNAIGFLKAGFRDVNQGMLNVAAQAKLTGQNEQQVIAGLARLYTTLPMTEAELGNLGNTLTDTSIQHGIAVTDLIGALEANITTLKEIAAVDPATAGVFREGIMNLTGELGMQHKDSISQFAKLISAGEGFNRAGEQLILFGGKIFDRLGKGNIGSAEMKEAILHANNTITQLQKSNKGADDRVLAVMYEGLGLDKQQVTNIQTMAKKLKEGVDETTKFRVGIERDFSSSLLGVKEEFMAPFKLALIPIFDILVTIGKFFTGLMENPVVRLIVEKLILFATVLVAWKAMSKMYSVLILDSIRRFNASSKALQAGGMTVGMRVAHRVSRMIPILGSLLTFGSLAVGLLGGLNKKEEEKARREQIKTKAAEVVQPASVKALQAAQAVHQEWMFRGTDPKSVDLMERMEKHLETLADRSEDGGGKATAVPIGATRGKK